MRSAALALLLLAGGACNDDKSYADPGLDVTPNNIAGVWRLAEATSGAPVEGTYVYVEFVRRDQTYVLYQNLDSFSARRITGRYNIETDEELGAVIRGMYDHGKGDWSHRYIVRDLTRERMTWIAQDDPDNVAVYVRCAGVPDEVLDELSATEE